MFLLQILFLSLFLVALLLLVLGIRGCFYGKRSASQHGTEGMDDTLTSHTGVDDGDGPHRKSGSIFPSVVMLCFSCLLFILAILPPALYYWKESKGDWIAEKPYWLLRLELENPEKEDKVIGQLIKRYLDEKLTQAQITNAMDFGLERILESQKDEATLWWLFFKGAWNRHNLTAAQVETFYSELIRRRYSFEVQSAERGQPFQCLMSIHCDPNTEFLMPLRVSEASEIAFAHLTFKTNQTSMIDFAPSDPWYFTIADQDWQKIKPGTYPVRLSSVITVMENGTTIHQETIKREATVEIKN